MFLPGLLIDMGAPPAEFRGVAAVALVRRHELDAAVTVLVVVPIHERHHPFTGLCLSGERPVWVVRLVFDRAEQGFRVGIVIRHPWPGERTQQPARCQLHRRARLPNRRRTSLRSGHRCQRQCRRGPQAPKHEGFQD